MKNIVNYIKKKLFKVEFYDSVENIPIYNYWKTEETGELKYLAIGKNYEKAFFYDPAEALKAWDKVNKSYLDVFGVSDHYKDVLMLQREVVLNDYIWHTQREPIAKVYAREAQKQLDSMKKDESVQVDKNDQIFMIEKEMGFEVDIKTMTIKKFYSYIKAINKLAKKINNGKKA
jgi:hypothetical protein